METEFGFPFSGKELCELKEFLFEQGLSYDESIGESVALREGGKIIAAASLDGETVKCFAAKSSLRGAGLSAKLMTELKKLAFSKGKNRLFLVTKPQNSAIFGELLFASVAEAAGAVFMESPAGGIDRFLEKIRAEAGNPKGKNGAVVLNGNPFTLGHRYLIKTAAAECEHLFVFVLSEEKSLFSAKARLEMARRGTADIKNVSVHKTEGYLVSSATFPSYFLKDNAEAPKVFCGIDIAVFGEKFAPALGITRRFAGTEPLCPVTAQYNEEMKRRLSEYGVSFIEIPRLEIGGGAVSASAVRKFLAESDFASAAALVPETTREFF